MWFKLQKDLKFGYKVAMFEQTISSQLCGTLPPFASTDYVSYTCIKFVQSYIISVFQGFQQPHLL